MLAGHLDDPRAILDQLAAWFGIVTPVNLVFALAIVVLLAVCVQLSAEVSGLEEETRTLAAPPARGCSVAPARSVG